MIKILKISSYVSIGLAVAVTGYVAFLGVGKRDDITEYLSGTRAIEKFKASAGGTASGHDQVSPLVRNAQAFALKIDPPPPPKPEKPRDTRPAGNQNPDKFVPEQRRIVSNAKFNLVATARYPDAPEKSLALLDLPADGLKWVRIGHMVEHNMIEEVGDGYIVYDNKRMEVPPVEKFSLLKSEVDSSPDIKSYTPSSGGAVIPPRTSGSSGRSSRISTSRNTRTVPSRTTSTLKAPTPRSSSWSQRRAAATKRTSNSTPKPTTPPATPANKGGGGDPMVETLKMLQMLTSDSTKGPGGEKNKKAMEELDKVIKDLEKDNASKKK